MQFIPSPAQPLAILPCQWTSSVPSPSTESLRLPKPSRTKSKFSHHCSAHHQTTFPSATATPFLSTSMGGDSTTPLGSLFQSLVALPVKNLSLISDFNLPWHNLRTFCLIPSLGTQDKRSTPTSLQTPQFFSSKSKIPALSCPADKGRITNL